jgi:hypothetical protein
MASSSSSEHDQPKTFYHRLPANGQKLALEDIQTPTRLPACGCKIFIDAESNTHHYQCDQCAAASCTDPNIRK